MGGVTTSGGHFGQGTVQQVPREQPPAWETGDASALPLAASGILQLDAVVALGGAAGAGVDDLARGDGCDLPGDG